jgi:predicted RNA methylase
MIKWDITTEDSSDSLRHVDCRGKNVLDLGCGRWNDKHGNWDNLDPLEFTPVFFSNRGANRVVGVEMRDGEAEFFRDYFKAEPEGKYVFIQEKIERANQLINLIHEFDINYVKTDIEGYESCFLSLTKEDLAPLDNFVIEYHSNELRESFIQKCKEWGFTITANGETWVNGIGVLFTERI